MATATAQWDILAAVRAWHTRCNLAIYTRMGGRYRRYSADANTDENRSWQSASRLAPTHYSRSVIKTEPLWLSCGPATVVRASFPLAAVAFFSVAVSGGGGLRVNWGALIICLAQSNPAQLSEMRYIPRGLRVDLGQGGVVTWVKDEVLSLKLWQNKM
jgi:hypothetical protein